MADQKKIGCNTRDNFRYRQLSSHLNRPCGLGICHCHPGHCVGDTGHDHFLFTENLRRLAQYFFCCTRCDGSANRGVWFYRGNYFLRF